MTKNSTTHIDTIDLKMEPIAKEKEWSSINDIKLRIGESKQAATGREPIGFQVHLRCETTYMCYLFSDLVSNRTL